MGKKHPFINGDTPMLVADIGGTQARFAFFYPADRTLGHVVSLKCKNYKNITDAVEHYLADKPRPTVACFAIAAPVSNDNISFVNSHWLFSITALKVELKLSHLTMINDFEANAYCISALKQNELKQVGKQVPVKGAPIVILGPGTGFGNTILLPDAGHVISTEGGHSGFSPCDTLELKLFTWAIENNISITRENFVSGKGLENIYRALGDIHAQVLQPLSAAEIGQRARDCWEQNTSDLCLDALMLFLGFLGNIAADQAISTGARGGVYIAGGITKRYIDIIEHSPFRARFENKGAMSSYTKAIPTYIITAEQPGLIGAGIKLLSE